MYKNEYKKQFGQNFLNNIETVIKFTDLLDIKKDDVILEIGPGDGSITEQLLNRGAIVTAIEIDNDLIDVLNNRFDEHIRSLRLKIINEDVLKVDIDKLITSKYKLVSALPYNISKMIIDKFLTKIKNKPLEMLLIMQKEVAHDYAYIKGQRKFLNIYANVYCNDITYLGSIDKSNFDPIPKVDGGIVRFKDIKKKIKDDKGFLKIVRAGFSTPRKKLSSNLSNIKFNKIAIESILIKNRLTKDSRAGELKFNDWLLLFNEIRIKE